MSAMERLGALKRKEKLLKLKRREKAVKKSRAAGGGGTKEKEVSVADTEWSRLGVHEDIVRALLEKGFAAPTQIQREAIPPAIREKRDIVGAAETVSKAM